VSPEPSADASTVDRAAAADPAGRTSHLRAQGAIDSRGARVYCRFRLFDPSGAIRSGRIQSG